MTASLQIKSNKYYVVLNWKEGDKRKQKWINTELSTTGNNKRKAEQKKLELLKQWQEVVEVGNYENITFANYLRKWLEETKRNITESTYSIYRNVIHGAICPYFDKTKVKLADLKAFHIQDFYNYKMEKEGISANTILHYHANIHNALKYAVKTEKIVRNPADGVELPKKEKHQADFYSPDELRLLLEKSKGTDLETVILIAAWFGFRRGEILGLKWDSIDFENKTITVSGTMVKVGSAMYYKNTAKTKSSLRTLPMTDETVEYLKALKRNQQENKSKSGEHYNTEWEDFVCVRKNGDILKLDYVTRHFPMICEECGLRKLHLHELRHSNISLLINAGASIKEVQEWAGHSTYSTTADIYAHIQSQSKTKLSMSIQNLLTQVG